MDDLALEIGLFKNIVIDQSDMTHPGCSEIERNRRPKTTRPDNQNRGRFKLALTIEPNFRDKKVAGIAEDFSAGEFE